MKLPKEIVIVLVTASCVVCQENGFATAKYNGIVPTASSRLTSTEAKPTVLEGHCGQTCIILAASGALAVILLCLVVAVYYAVCKDKERGFKSQTKTWEDKYLKSNGTLTKTDKGSSVIENQYSIDGIRTSTSKDNDTSSTLGRGNRAKTPDYSQSYSTTYPMDGYDLYSVPSYAGLSSTYNPGLYEHSDSVSYYDDTASKYSESSTNPRKPKKKRAKALSTQVDQGRALTPQLDQSRALSPQFDQSRALSPQFDQSRALSPQGVAPYDVFHYNTIAYSGNRKATKNVAINEPYNTIGSSVRAKRNITQKMYTIEESPDQKIITKEGLPKKSNLKKPKEEPQKVAASYGNDVVIEVGRRGEPYYSPTNRVASRQVSYSPNGHWSYHPRSSSGYSSPSDGEELPTIYQDRPSSTTPPQISPKQYYSAITNELLKTGFFDNGNSVIEEGDAEKVFEEKYLTLGGREVQGMRQYVV